MVLLIYAVDLAYKTINESASAPPTFMSVSLSHGKGSVCSVALKGSLIGILGFGRSKGSAGVLYFLGFGE